MFFEEEEEEGWLTLRITALVLRAPLPTHPEWTLSDLPGGRQPTPCQTSTDADWKKNRSDTSGPFFKISQ